MNCNEFRQSIAERLDGDLSANQVQEFDAHEHGCSGCRAAMVEWRQLTDTLRAAWPSVDPPARRFFLPPKPRSSWLEATQRWLGYASTALVAASLLLLVIFRPSIHMDRSQLAVSFGTGGTKIENTSATPVTQEQVRTWTQAAFREAMSQRTTGEQQTAQAVADRTGQDTQHLSQLAVRLKLMEETQASLWQRNEEQRLYLQTLWKGSSVQGAPVTEKPGEQR
jgi:hypothetical protein